MSQQLQILINQVILFATLIVIGYASEKKGYLKDSDIDALSTLCVKVMIPAMIISVIFTGFFGKRLALLPALTGKVRASQTPHKGDVLFCKQQVHFFS